MAQTDDSNGEIWHNVQFIQTIRMEKYGTNRRFECINMAQTDDSNGEIRFEWRNMAQSADYSDDSSGEVWHNVQFIQKIRMEKYGTNRRFEWRNMAQCAVYTDDSNANKWHKVHFIQIILMGHMAPNLVYTDSSNGDIWHRAQCIQTILTRT